MKTLRTEAEVVRTLFFVKHVYVELRSGYVQSYTVSISFSFLGPFKERRTILSGVSSIAVA